MTSHGAADQGGTRGHDDHSHVSDALGPIDLEIWGAGIVGILLGLIVAVCLLVAAGGI